MEQYTDEEDESTDDFRTTSMKREWKPAHFISYETMGLTTTKLNPTVRPCGFKANGKSRMIKSTCLLARMKRINMLRK